MARSLNLRQIEAFKAVMEKGTVSRAAESIFVSQPAVSKLIAHLEMDTGLRLFDRVQGRLRPTRQAERLLEEIERIFSGIHQVERAVEAIRREEQGQIVIGVAPSLSGTFIEQTTRRFLAAMPGAKVLVQISGSPAIPELLLSRSIDVGLGNGGPSHPDIDSEDLLHRSLVCIMPHGHRLSRLDAVQMADIEGENFIAFRAGYTRSCIDRAFAEHSGRLKIVLEASSATTIREFVASGIGVALIHPLFAYESADRVTVRPYRPAIQSKIIICRARSQAPSRLVDAFFAASGEAARDMDVHSPA